MSINVTVSGNPISIKRGKMVTADPNNAKQEFDKRRLMRLEQVRQQSKDIAEEVRNKVRKEKKRQVGEIEREGKAKLKNWQNRKLLEIQNQYHEALRDMGMGHKQAAALEDESEVIEEQKELIEKTAKRRGCEAACRLQVDKNQKNYRDAKPIQQRKLVRDVENARSALVTKLKKNKPTSPVTKKKRRRSASADINITIPDTDTENDVADSSSSSVSEEGGLPIIQEETSSSDSCTCSEREDPREPLNVIDENSTEEPSKRNNSISATKPPKIVPESSKSSYKSAGSRPVIESKKMRDVPKDTRISDRIKRREIIASQPDFCDMVGDVQPVELPETSTKMQEHLYKRRPVPSFEFEKFSSENESDSYLKSKGPSVALPSQVNDVEEIPDKPAVKLTDNFLEKASRISRNGTDSNKVPYYDHPNRFFGESSQPRSSYVEKITNDSIEVVPNLTSEAELRAKSKQRDRDAFIRGQKALEKEKVHRDYQELMKRLPVLQKQERIIEIKSDKPEYHMSEERLKEMERKRQNKMENAYSKLFAEREPALVTLPRNVNAASSSSPPTLNVGTWDVDHSPSKMFSAEEVQQIVEAFNGDKPQDRREKLKQLLKSLKSQKDQLVKEIKALPKDNSIAQLLKDLDDTSNSTEHIKRKRSPEESLSSSESTSETRPSRDVKEKHRHRRRHTADASPRKRARRPPVLVLQNTSTQTTPKPVEEKEGKITAREDKDVQTTLDEPDTVCSKTHVRCDCRKKMSEKDAEKEKQYTEELCQIVIKINDEDMSEVLVKPINKEEVVVSKPREETVKMKPVSPSRSIKKKQPTTSRTESKKGSIRKDRPPSAMKSKSWRDELSKNSVSTLSTSYMSPPDFSTFAEYSKRSFYMKSQQRNATDSTPTNASSVNESRIDPRLLTYIKKLLSMSKQSIDNLTVSTSGVETPSQSVIETETNNPMAQLNNIIKFFNLRMEDIAKELSCSPETSDASQASPVISEPTHQQDKSGDIKDQSPKSYKTDTSSKSVPDTNKSKESVSMQYADITDSCSRRIANLALMIQKLRAEKLKMLETSNGSSSSSTSKSLGDQQKSPEKDYSTAYLDLPDLPAVESRSSSKESSGYSLDEEELNSKLFKIDMSLANRLRKYKPTDAHQENPPVNEDTDVTSPDNVDPFSSDQELLVRLHRLMKNSTMHHPPPNSPETASEKDVPFVPLLLDIPKLPKLELQPDPHLSHEISGSIFQKKPPPSKGLSVARKFNGNISLVPHELSTIIEADSQISTKVDLISPKSSIGRVSPQKNGQMEINVPDTKVKSVSEGSSSKSDKDLPDILTEIAQTCGDPVCREVQSLSARSKSSGHSSGKKSPTSDKSSGRDDSGRSKIYRKSEGRSAPHSSSSNDDIEAVETMLKSIGMAWAIPTLHKTQEALALTSSSSSLDFSGKSKYDSSSSEVSLKDFLKKQLMSKVSSSTLRTDGSPFSLLEFSELSAIQANSSLEKSKPRTSTPVVSSKSTSKSLKQVVFSDNSDISSVKDSSTDKNSFHSLNEQSRSKHSG